MKVKELKYILNEYNDNAEIFIRNTVNPCGNIQELEQVQLSTYSSFGTVSSCLILNTNTSKNNGK